MWARLEEVRAQAAVERRRLLGDLRPPRRDRPRGEHGRLDPRDDDAWARELAAQREASRRQVDAEAMSRVGR